MERIFIQFEYSQDVGAHRRRYIAHDAQYTGTRRSQRYRRNVGKKQRDHRAIGGRDYGVGRAHRKGVNDIFFLPFFSLEEKWKIINGRILKITQVVETFQMKVPASKGPIAESEYWKDREIGLLMLVEQLKTPMAKRILNVLNKVQSTIASNFQFFYSDLWKTYTEARDNNRFLSTLLRHFKVRGDRPYSRIIGREELKIFGCLFLFFRYAYNYTFVV